MNTIFKIALCTLVLWTCGKPDDPVPFNPCDIPPHGVLGGNLMLDTIDGSKYWMLPVLFTDVWWQVIVSQECKGGICVRTDSMKITNIVADTMDLRLHLEGHAGDLWFTIPPGDTIDILPKPDYCLKKRWGDILEIKYR